MAYSSFILHLYEAFLTLFYSLTLFSIVASLCCFYCFGLDGLLAKLGKIRLILSSFFQFMTLADCTLE